MTVPRAWLSLFLSYTLSTFSVSSVSECKCVFSGGRGTGADLGVCDKLPLAMILHQKTMSMRSKSGRPQILFGVENLADYRHSWGIISSNIQREKN